MSQTLYPEVLPTGHDFPFPVSPSAVGTAILCWRLYGWEYLGEIPRESTPEQQLGTDTHTVHENWFTKGIAPKEDGDDPNRLAFATMHLWPSPNLVDEIELHVWVMTEHGLYHGFQDIGYLDKKRHLRVVGDHKTTSDLKWVKDEEDLKKDPQAIIYAAAAMVRHNVDRVVVKWVYVTRGEKPKRKVVEFELTRAEVEAGLDFIDTVATEIYKVRADAKNVKDIVAYILSLPYNAGACGAYGGCRHAKAGRCVLTNKEKIRGFMAQQTLKERLADKQKAAKSNGAPTEELKPSGKVTVAAKGVGPVGSTLTAKEKAAAAAAEAQRLQDEADAEEQAAKDAEDLAQREAEEAAKGKSKPPKKDKAAAKTAEAAVSVDADGDMEVLDAMRIIVREELQAFFAGLAGR